MFIPVFVPIPTACLVLLGQAFPIVFGVWAGFGTSRQAWGYLKAGDQFDGARACVDVVVAAMFFCFLVFLIYMGSFNPAVPSLLAYLATLGFIWRELYQQRLLAAAAADSDEDV